MAGYSGTPLPKKLGIKDGHRVALLNAPDGILGTLGELPGGGRVVTTLDNTAEFDVILLFTTTMATLPAAFSEAAGRLQPAGGLWVCWPKRASGVATDVSENPVRDVALAAGLVDNKVCAIDETWSGLRCVYRVKDRARGA